MLDIERRRSKRIAVDLNLHYGNVASENVASRFVQLMEKPIVQCESA